MKHIITLILFFSISQLYSQTLINDSTYKSADSLIFKIGEKITLGTGTQPDGKYKFIYLNPANGLAIASGDYSITYLGSGWSGLNFTIRKFKKAGNKKVGYKYYFLVDGGNISNYAVDIEPSIESGEVKKANSHK